MAANRKVVWAEGVMLGQQHFQLWDTYLQRQQQLYQHYAHPFYWGIAQIEFDDQWLAQGVIKINRVVALLNDRRWVDFNQTVDEPLTVPVPDAVTQTISVFLGLPETDYVDGITGYPETAHSSAWQGQYISVHDMYDSARQREVLMARQNLRLFLDDKPKKGFSVIKIAELDYNSQQAAYRYKRSFIPPILFAGSCDGLMSWLAGLIGKLRQQITILNEQKEKHKHVANQFGYGDFIYFNLVKTLTTHFYTLSALQRAPQVHPFQIYEACVQLLGELSGYLDSPLGEPVYFTYEHHALTGLFVKLGAHFDALIHNVIPVNTLDVSLHRINETQYQSVSLSDQDLKHKQFCLAVYHENMTQELIDKLLAQVKISAPSQLMNIIHSFTQGIEFTYVTTPGNDLMAKRHYHYFLLNKTSTFWEEVLKEGMISFFVSQELASCSFEIISY